MSRTAEITHFLGGSPLNRVSWLRSSTKFLNIAAGKPETRWVVFRAGQPLVTHVASSEAKKFALLRTAHVQRFLGEEPVFGQGHVPGEAVLSDLSVPVLEACRLRGAPVVFLGLKEPDETEALSSSSEFSTSGNSDDTRGAPYFSVDITHISQSEVEDFLKHVAQDGEVLEFIEPRSAAAAFNVFEAAIFAESRSMLDWNTRNKFCAACGSPTYSLWGGWKLSCLSLLPWNTEGKNPCPSGTGLQNFAHPRTDPVVIVAVIDDTGDHILLGRNKKFPDNMYSILAGFCEPAESFEDAARREVWEESGLRVHDVHYHSSQPWPYPASLMVGCYAFADRSQTIRTDLDNELDEARWFTREEVMSVLNHIERINQRQSEYQFDDAKTSPLQVEREKMGVPPFRVPARRTIAGVMISDWAAGRYGGSSALKGNL